MPMRPTLWVLALAVATGCPPEAVRRPDPDPIVKPPQPKPDADVRAVAERFVQAAEKGDFAAALRLLAAPLRDRYTADRLAADFKREPLAAERVSRIRAALSRSFELEAERARLPLDGSRALVLVKEKNGWFVASLE